MPSPARLAAVFISAAIFLSGCASFDKLTQSQSKMAQTPITDKPSGKAIPGKFIWHDLLTPEPKKAGAFYEALFGWQIDYQEHYAVVRNGDKLIAGIVKPNTTNEAARNGLWIPTASVADVDAAVRRVTANGGTVLKGPLNMGDRGRAVMISDPQRADMLLLSAKGGDPADGKAAIGDWLWDEIWSKDPDSVEAFYAAVLGYDQVMSTDDYTVFLSEGEWRAGIRRVKSHVKHLLWVPVVRVADSVATAKRTKELGGTVLVAPGEVPGNADIALIADPTGAFLLIQRWPAPVTKDGASL
ncbi:MAG: VOC family protein [Gammaproteobacteria bacterium]|nr:VOC family protein [Gammaproteobacteria bacterium]MBQ0838248.1 VOC family protein [Gammaproteobacteria bacterium]